MNVDYFTYFFVKTSWPKPKVICDLMWKMNFSKLHKSKAISQLESRYRSYILYTCIYIYIYIYIIRIYRSYIYSVYYTNIIIMNLFTIVIAWKYSRARVLFFNNIRWGNFTLSLLIKVKNIFRTLDLDNSDFYTSLI